MLIYAVELTPGPLKALWEFYWQEAPSNRYKLSRSLSLDYFADDTSNCWTWT